MAITTRKRYSKGKRVDMRQGGRVGLARGKGVKPKKKAEPKPRPQTKTIPVQAIPAERIPPAQQKAASKQLKLGESNRLATEEPVGAPSNIPAMQIQEPPRPDAKLMPAPKGKPFPGELGARRKEQQPTGPSDQPARRLQTTATPKQIISQQAAQTRKAAPSADPKTQTQTQSLAGQQQQLKTQSADTLSSQIMQYLGTDAGDAGTYQAEFDINGDGTVDMLDITKQLQNEAGTGKDKKAGPVKKDTTASTTTDTLPVSRIEDPEGYARWLAGGEGARGAAVIPEAERVDVGGFYSAEEVNKSWQDGGLQGTLLTNEQGLTGQNIFEALYEAGDGTKPADSVEIDGVTYTWDDFNNLIDQEATDFIGKEKLDSPYRMETTKMQALSDEQRAKATKAEYTPDETVDIGTAADDVTTEAYEAATYDAATIAYKKDAEGNLILDEKGDPIPATPDITAAQQVDAEGKTILTKEATATEIAALSQKFVAAGMPEDEALKEAEAVFTVGLLSDEAEALKQTGVGAQMSETPEAERSTREEITGSVADGDEAQIGGVPTFSAATRDQVTGTARTRTATDMLEETADLPPDITAAIVEDPATVEAQMDENPVEVQAAIAALPEEALVSSQMSSLIAGIEDGTTPTWARPAVDSVTQMMAERGLDVSTVARDSLFNAIIQTALPMAQSNAQALQARAAQNLSNEQQANLAQATQDMQRRMANLSNRQTSESQTAQMAQQIAIQQGQFRQEAVAQSAAQQQQTRVQNLQNQQEAARVTAQNEAQVNLANLGNEQQIATMDLQIEATRLQDQMSAEQQGRLAKFQTASDFMAKNAAFTQQMETANLSKDIQVELANLQSKNLYQSELMTNDEKIELANLQSKMQVGITNANLANAMGVAQLNSDQTIAISNAQIVAGMDMANFSMEQQMELANSKFMQTITMQDFSQKHQGAMQDATAMAALDMATVDQRTKLAITNANNFLQMDMANLNNRQQEAVLEAQMKQQALLSDQAATNASLQFNATSENQTNQFMTNLAAQIDLNNAARNDNMEQFNAAQKNAAEARRVGIEADIAKFDAQLVTQVDEFNAQQDFARNQWNAQNSAAVEASNVDWRRQANTINTAAQNAINAQNAQNAFQMNTQSLSYLWQELRDQADFDFRAGENEENRKAQIVATALANEGDPGKVYDAYLTQIVSSFATSLNSSYTGYGQIDIDGPPGA